MKKGSTYCYELHPTLAAFYAHWSALCASALPLLVPRNSLSCLLPGVMLYCDPPVTNPPSASDAITRQIIGPLLPVLFWDAPSAPPEEVRWIKCELDDAAVVQNLVAEWLRWIVMMPDPLFAEQSRQVFSKLLDKQQRVRLWGVKKLSQREWGELVGLTREQLARGAAALKKQSSPSGKTSMADDDEALNFFKARHGIRSG